MSCSIRLITRSVFLIACVLTLISIFRTLPVSFHNNRNPTPILQFSHQHELVESEKIPEPESTGFDAEFEVVGEEDEWDLEQENIPELPLILGNSSKPKQHNASCATFPDLFRVQFSNIHWQVQKTTFETYFLYAAYLDVRGRNNGSDLRESNITVRILAMSDNFIPITNNTELKVCQFWFEEKRKPEFGNVVSISSIWQGDWGLKGHYFPSVITCQFPKSLTRVPSSVSLVSEKCVNATNNLIILHREQVDKIGHIPEKNFGVCVKALDFPDGYMASRLVEWIETLRMLGADKIFFYEFYVNSTIKTVLDYYETTGLIDVKQTTLPGELPNHPQIRHLYIREKYLDKRLTELIPYNDCLLRRMYDFKYMVVIDTDEVIMPKTDGNWTKLLEEVISKDIRPDILKKVTIASFCFHNVYFVDNITTENDTEISEIPHDYHMLQHIYRARRYTAHKHMKCFHSTSEILAVHNHFAFYCIKEMCVRYYVDFKRAQLNHYRSTCVADIKNCNSYLMDNVKDTSIWRYKDQIIDRANDVMKNLNT